MAISSVTVMWVRAKSLVPAILVGVVPVLLLGSAIALYTLNHFFSHSPYLLDTGMLSSLVYRDGLSLPIPQIACDYASSFYDVYFSPIVSLFSMVSYVVPIDRMEWFAVVEAICYAPLGIAVWVVSSRLDPASRWRRLPISVITAIAFSFNGTVLWMVGFPHLEAAIPAFACVMLGAFVTGRTKLGWVFLVLTASVRQDGAFIVALTLAPLVFLSWRGVVLAQSRKTLITACLVGIGFGVAGMLCQRLFFHPFPRMTQAYFGTPIYGHLTWSLFADRIRVFLDLDRHLYFPLIGIVVLAIIRRDARYLLGWLAFMPWFALGFFAVEDMKASFFAYCAGPFIIPLFWVYAYGAHLAPKRLRPLVMEAVFAALCVSSFVGYEQAIQGFPGDVVRDMVISHVRGRAATHQFVEALADHRADLGDLHVDSGIAALAIEHLDLINTWRPGGQADTIALHRQAMESKGVMADVIANNMQSCAHVIGTQIVVCSRSDRASALLGDPNVEPLFPAFANANFGHRTQFLEDGKLVVHYKTYGWLGTLRPGRYEMSVTTDGTASLEITVERPYDENHAIAIKRGTGTLTVRFDVSDSKLPFVFSIGTGAKRLEVSNAVVRSVDAMSATK